MILTVMPLFSGCIAIVAAGAGAGAYAYLKGGLDSHLSASIETSIPAARRAMTHMGLVKVKEISDIKSAKLVYRDSLGIKISIHLTQKQSNLTEVSIRVGHVGDENRSIQILNNIKNQL